MADQGIKSRPIYSPVGLDATGARHLLVVDAAQVPPEGLRTELGVFPEVWTVSRDGRQPPSQFMRPKGPESETHVFRSLALLFDALKQRLTRETMGFRLYAIGSETFLADVQSLGTAAGLSRSEMALAQSGSLSRRVYCVHCRTLTEGASANVITCSGCGTSLFVRDHFSVRLAAFMGVVVDAEEPGALPDIETLYP
jgi:dimethylamine monooxygenase subunit C